MPASRRSHWTIAVVAAVLLTGCRGTEPLPDLGIVPPFTLQDQHGATVDGGSLASDVWIANFVFTHCPDICPALSQQMARLQRDLPGRGGSAIHLVSISVDPTRDTPEVLSSYATQLGAGPSWRFLTGERAAVAKLLRDGFHVAWTDDGPPGMPITHSDRFVLVDRRQHIRGYYHGMDAAEMTKLVDDAVRLQSHPDE